VQTLCQNQSTAEIKCKYQTDKAFEAVILNLNLLTGQ